MKKDEAKKACLQLWRSWPGDKGNAAAPLSFYNWLDADHPQALDFGCSGDKYQVVAGWVGNQRS
jgi:hypothetical protein